MGIEDNKNDETNKVEGEFEFLQDQRGIIDPDIELKNKDKKLFKSSMFWINGFHKKIYYHSKTNSLSKESIRIALLHEAGHLYKRQNCFYWILISGLSLSPIYIYSYIKLSSHFFAKFGSRSLLWLTLLEPLVNTGVSILLLIPLFLLYSVFWHLSYTYLKEDEIRADEHAAHAYKKELIQDQQKKVSDVFSDMIDELEELKGDKKKTILQNLWRILFPDPHPDNEERVKLIEDKFDS